METLTSTSDESVRPSDPAPPAGSAPHDDPASESVVLASAVLCADGRRRCPWALSGPAVLADHDTSWGSAPTSARDWFRSLSLELLQAGLAPGTALSRLPALEAAFAGFDPAVVALLDDEAIDELLLDRALIRNRAKLTAVVLAARAVQSWEAADWEQTVAAADGPGHPVRTQAVVQLLRDRGIVHAGPGTVGRLLARTGHAPAHVAGCFRE